MSLYQKYRPQDFESLIGQKPIKNALLNSIKSGNISHAYLFSGPRGTGKTTTARLIAKAVNCEKIKDDGSFCNACQHCKSINDGSFVDLIEIDAASNTGVDNIRDLQSKIGFSPTQGKKKVYVLDEAHMLSKGAFNALLKTLEEPPEFVHFILVTTELHKVPDTVISRCIIFNFKNIEDSDISSRLKYICEQEGLDCEEDALDMIAHRANGGLRDAISMLDKLRSEGMISKQEVQGNLGLTANIVVEEFLGELFDGNTLNSLSIVNELLSKGYDMQIFVTEVLESLREKMLTNVGNELQLKQLIEVIAIFSDAQERFKYSVIVQLPIEMAIVKSSFVIGKKDDSSKNSNGLLDKIFPKKNQEKKSNKLVKGSESAESSGSIKGDEGSEFVKGAEASESAESSGSIRGAGEAKEKKEKIDIEKIHESKKQVIETLPELNIDNLKKFKSDIEKHIKTAAFCIAFRNSLFINLSENEIDIETVNSFDQRELSSQKAVDELLKAFTSVFGDMDYKFNFSHKPSQDIKEVVDKNEDKKSSNINEVAESIFDF